MLEKEFLEEEGMLSDKALYLINNDVVAFLETVKDLVEQLTPQLKKLMHEASPTVTAIRANIDRDETLLLVEKLTANTGMLIELISLVEALNDLRKEIEPQVKKLTAEAGPQLSAIRANIDRDETLLLVEKLTANTGTFLELIGYLEALNDLKSQLEPQLKKLMHEASPTVTAIRANIDRDEMLLLVEKLTANTGMLIELISLVEALNDLRKEIEPQVKKLMHEVSPMVTTLRLFAENERTWELAKRSLTALQAFAEDDEVLDLIERAPSLRRPMVRLVDCLCSRTGDGDGETAVADASVESLLKLTEIASAPVVQNLVAAAATAVKEVDHQEIKQVSPLGMFAALRDDDVQRAIGFLFYFLKKLGQGLKDAP